MSDRRGFIGIDVGTQGVRLILVDQQGNQIYSGGESLRLTERSREEQSPQEWWQACLRLLKTMSAAIKPELSEGFVIESIAATSTSGTVIPLDRHNNALHPAIMYSDQRSAACSVKVKKLAEEYF